MSKRKCLLVSVVVLGVVSLFSGCFFERIAWSPDGKSLVFTEHEPGGLWAWDLGDGPCELLVPQLEGPDGTVVPFEKETVACRYMPNGKQILFLSEESEGGLYLMDMETKKAEMLAEDVEMFFDVGADGRIIYLLKDDESKLRTVWERDKDGARRAIFSSKEDVAFPRLSPDGKQMAYAIDDKGVFVFDIATSTTNVLPLPDIEMAYWIFWAGQDRIVFCTKNEQEKRKSENDVIGDLVLAELSSGKVRTLLSGVVHFLYPLSLSPDGKSVALTAVCLKEGETFDNGRPDQMQVVSVDLETGEKTQLTDSPLGAISPAFSPDGQHLAYYIIAGDNAMLEVKNLKTDETKVAWRNEMEHLYSEGNALLSKGETEAGIAKFEILMRTFPDEHIATAVQYRLILLYLEDEERLDRAYDMLLDMDVTLSDLPPLVSKMLWRESDRLATDPPVDWVQTYSTQESRKEFEFDTDSARDLRSVWVRAGEKRLYVRVELESDEDLQGLRFQDMALLFDTNSPDRGRKEITESTDWDRGAERVVLVRHWYEANAKSQYDMEIRDGKGELVGHYLASGFSKPENPLLNCFVESDERGQFVTYAISRKALGVRKGQKIQIQVCSFKGGIESAKGLEKPRVTKRDGSWVCDVADTFGDENLLERIEADQKKEGESARPVIKGFAGEFTIE